MISASVTQGEEVKIVFVDDHEIFHDCIRHLFDLQENMLMLGVANNGWTAIKVVRESSPDVVVMDISMPGLNGIDATRRILSENPDIRIIALSMHSDREMILQILKAGARGYVLKDCAFQDLVTAIKAVTKDQMYLSPKITGYILNDFLNAAEQESSFEILSPREREVLQLVTEGRATRQVAEHLNVSIKTVETHRSQIMRKLNLKSLPELTKYALREGLTSLDF